MWLDQREAKVFEVSLQAVQAEKVLALKHHVRHSETTREPRLDTFERHYFRDVVEALARADAVLVVGPGQAKLAFLKFVYTKAHELAARIVGVETVDHPSDSQLVAYARNYFHIADHRAAAP